MIQKIAEQLLNRKLSKRDGFSEALIEKTEKRLGFSLPQTLRSFYLSIGKNLRFSESFNRFITPEYLEVEYGKLIFLAENQQVCFWAIDIKDISCQKITVYQTHADGEFFSEQADLEEFIRINLYYQLAQGGYAYCGTIDVENKQKLALVLQLLSTNNTWQKVVHDDGLVIYCKQNQLIWYLSNENNEVHEQIFASTLLKQDLNALIRDLDFSDLN